MKFDPQVSVNDEARTLPLPVVREGLAHEAFAPTVAAAEARPGDSRNRGGDGVLLKTAAEATLAGARSTVLPRIEVIGSEHTLVVDTKRRFEQTRPLGEGGVGYVVGAEDHDIGRPVALKRLRPSAKDPASLIRFVEEIRTIGRLEHPNIVPIHDVGVDEDGEYYFVMKYVDGETLEAIITKLAKGDADYHRRYTFERRLEIWKGVLDAISFAHDKGIIHRDIKPSNVMIGHHGEVMVMDWGIAKAIRETVERSSAGTEIATGEQAMPPAWRTQLGQFVGTPAYMSPEQARGVPVDERSDIYSLCMLLHEFITLKHPLESKTTLEEVLAAVITEDVPVASLVKSPYQPSIPMDLTWIIRAGLRKDPKDRYPSVNTIIERLERRIEGDIPVQCHITFLVRASNVFSRFVRHHPGIVTLVLAGLLIAVITLLVQRS